MNRSCDCDVLILGTGLASLCLTRLLQLKCPTASVQTLDVRKGPERKVGESTVEIGAHFLHTRLQLDDLLRESQLPKNGLRFWFDSEQNDLSLSEASEDGPITFSYWQSFQIDRETFETSLVDLNRAGGAVHRFDLSEVRVEETDGGEAHQDAHQDAHQAHHRVSFVEGTERRQVTARWLVDATGLKSLWGRPNGLLESEERIPHGACWARFKGCDSPDRFLEERQNRKAIVGRRLLSTNHLMNEGYWIWWIPLAGGLMSVGLVYDRTELGDAPQNLEEFVRFLRKHRMCAELMEGAEPVDFGRLGKFAFQPKQYFFRQRIAAIGMAAGFIDPFYSGGSDFIAMECEYLGDLIRRDLAGEEPDDERLEAYNVMVAAFYEQTILFVSGLYKTFASYELSVPRYRRDLHVYWNLYVRPYFSGEFLDPGFIHEFRPLADDAVRRSAFFNRLFQEAHRVLKERGQLRRRNRGAYAFNQLGYGLFPYIRFERQMGHPVDLPQARELLDEIDTGTLLAVMDVLFDGDQSPVRRLLYDAVRGATLERLIDLAPGGRFGDDFWDEVFRQVTSAARSNLARRGVDLDGLEICPQTFGRLRTYLVELCGGDKHVRKNVEEYYLDTPRLETFSGLPPMRDKVQPLGPWSFSHSPWNVEPFDTQTVYEIMEERSGSRIAEWYK